MGTISSISGFGFRARVLCPVLVLGEPKAPGTTRLFRETIDSATCLVPKYEL
jgi:hypothetical protein